MRTILQNLMMIMIAVFLTGSFAIPHICLDNDDAQVKVEQQAKVEKTATNDHQDGSKAFGHCCASHHCCSAKLINPTQSVWKVGFVSKTGLSITDQNRLASFNPKGLDRPPKFFA